MFENSGIISTVPIASDTSSKIDWSKMTVASSTFGRVTAPTTSKKNLFQNRLAADGRVSDLMVASARDSAKLFLIQKEELESKVRHAIKNDSKCMGCKHVAVATHEMMDHKNAERLIRVTAACGLDKPGFTAVCCPDGQIVSKADKVTMTTTMEVDPVEFPENAKSAPEFSTKNEEPYIRVDPDKPSTKGDLAAW